MNSELSPAQYWQAYAASKAVNRAENYKVPPQHSHEFTEAVQGTASHFPGIRQAYQIFIFIIGGAALLKIRTELVVHF